jgi:spermidine synthase
MLALFLCSGFAALIHEVVWLQLLQLMLGSTAIAMSVVLATFMGGLCLGSIALPQIVSQARHPLRVFGAIELGIGAFGLTVLFVIPRIDRVYAEIAGRGLNATVLDAIVAVICLLPPTLLMGATLPALARWVDASKQGAFRLGLCYGANLAGGVVGCLFAGFYLLRVFDMITAGCVASAINIVGGAFALAVASRTQYDAPSAASADPQSQPEVQRAAVYLTIALSGAAALGGEVVWTRLLSLLFGGTVYAFSLILAVFLAGLGLGSGVGAWVARKSRSPVVVLGICQWLLTAAIAWTAFAIARWLPYWPFDPTLAPSPTTTFLIDLARSLCAILPPACLWGASFPLALAAAMTPGADPGRVAARISAANTLGAIAGAVGFSLFLVPILGTGGCEQLLIGLSIAAALVAMIASPGLALEKSRRARVEQMLALGVLGVVAAGLAWRVTPIPWPVIAYGRHAATANPDGDLAPGITPEALVPDGHGKPSLFCIYEGEGANVSVAVTQTRDGYRNFHGAGKVQASTLPKDMRLQRMLGHLPALLHKKPKTVLVVACGAGITAGCFVLHPDVERIVICDIEPLVPTKVAPHFGIENYHVTDGIADRNPQMVNGKQVEVIYDDGRHFLRTTREKFDVITSDPIDPWVKGCAALNTIEYYQACRDHLNPGGSVSLWIPLYETDLDSAKSFIGTFLSVFPDGILWSNEEVGAGYDGVLYGQAEPTVIDVDEFRDRLQRPKFEPVRQSLLEVGFGSETSPDSEFAARRETAIELLATFAAHGRSLVNWWKKSQVNTDMNLRLQYLAGLSLNESQAPEILQSIVAHYRFPEETFVGSAARLAVLRSVLDGVRRPQRTLGISPEDLSVQPLPEEP